MMIIPPKTTPYGRQQPLGCHWCNKRQREETIMLANILHQCVIWATSPQHILWSHTRAPWVPGSGSGRGWLVYKEIWEGVRKDPVVATVTTKNPSPKSPTIDGWSRGAYPLYFTRPSICAQTRRGGTSSGPGSGVQKVATTNSWVFFPGPRGPCHATLWGHLPAWSHDLVTPLCTRVTIDDHLPHPSNGHSPLLPSGSEPYQDIPTEHIFSEAPGTLSKGPRTLINFNALLHHEKTCPKYWLKQIPAFPTKWILELGECPLSQWSEF